MSDYKSQALIALQPEQASLRDMFAIAALTGILANPSEEEWDTIEDAADDLCEVAYIYADAMLKARGKKP
jgi:hypothetical protein